MLFNLFKRQPNVAPPEGPPPVAASARPRRGAGPASVAGPPATQGDRAGGSDTEALLHRLEWTVIRRLDGLLQGDYRTLMRGSGLDLADLREYQHHDDVRHMDWSVTARLQQPHVRVFTEDREMAAWFLLDLSPSVDFGSGEQRKSDLLTGFVAVLARLISRHGNRVGAVLYGSGGSAGGGATVDAVLPARGGRAQVLQLMHAMRRAMADSARLRQQKPASRAKKNANAAAPAAAAASGSPRAAAPGSGSNSGKGSNGGNGGNGGSGSNGGSGGTRLADLLRAASLTVRQRCTVFVVSDFISEPGWERPLGELARRHDVVAVRLLDPLELALPNLGLVTVRDAETGEQMMVDMNDSGFRQRFARLAAQREAQLRESLARAGVDTLELSTGDDLADAVLRFVDLRQRRVQRLGSNRGLTRPVLQGAATPAPTGVRA